jgi:hypothetical protein
MALLHVKPVVDGFQTVRNVVLIIIAQCVQQDIIELVELLVLSVQVLVQAALVLQVVVDVNLGTF